MATGILVGALILFAPAKAQDAAGAISERIEGTFDLVLGNPAELAIPLTRRALARRFNGDDQSPRVTPLAYGATEDAAFSAPESTSSIDRPPSASTAPVVEQGSAEDPEEDPDVARLPRPRPGPVTETAAATAPEPVADDSMEGPLDLVAGAAEPGVEAQLAAVAPQPVVAPGLPSELLAGATPVTPPTEPLPELVASGSCLSPGEVTDKDGDFERNAETLSGNAFCIAEETFKERRRTWRIATVKTSRPGPLFAVMHDDEDMSFDNAVAALSTYGGTLVAVEAGGKRNQDGIDPNRNFSADGVGCKKLGNNATPKYTDFFRQLFDASQPIIALHNNTGKRIPTGGLGHVSMDGVPKDMEKHESHTPGGPLAGERTLVLLTSVVPVSTTSRTMADQLSAKGINAVIEGVSKGKGDCSFSNYTLLTGHPDYLNVTVDDDERDKQRQIIDVIMSGRTATVATQ